MMKNFLITVALCLFAMQATAQLQRVTPRAAGMNVEKLKNADKIILESIARNEIPGAVLAIVRHGKMAYIKAYGNKQVYPAAIPMTENTVFDMASVSKSMSTAICAMILLEQGKIRMNDNVRNYIPGYKGWENEKGRQTDIKIIDILTHTSGLPPYADVDSAKAKYGAPNRDGLIEHIATCKRDFAPKTDFQYSCLNFITLQRIIEKVSGQDLRSFAKENIFDVLDMKHTDYNPEGETLALCAPTEKQADGSVLSGKVHDPLARIMNDGISGNAGVFSNADDIAILAAALLNNGKSVLNGKRILSPLTVKLMRTVPASVKQFGRTPGWDIYSPYASNNGDIFGANTFGHTGYTGTSLIIDPDTNTAVILLTNRVHPEDKGSVVRLRALVANAVAGAIEE
jgi:CubicO group peptidase (beta-lactamase class C family)